MNKSILIGRLTKDVELKYTTSQTAVASFPLAVDRKVQKGKEKETDFINIVLWGKTAENAAQYTGKGKLIAVIGRIQTRSYEAKDGGKRYVTEVVGEEVQFLEWAKNEGKSSNDEDAFASLDTSLPYDDGDIPF